MVHIKVYKSGDFYFLPDTKEEYLASQMVQVTKHEAAKLIAGFGIKL